MKLLEEEDSHVLAGGTDLLRLIRNSVVKPKTLIDLKDIPEIRGIRESDDGGLRIGSFVTLRELERDTSIRKKYPLLSEAAHSVAFPEIRNMGTVGGNLLQDVQCWYYRKKRYDCIRKGGNTCYAIRGEHRWYHLVFNPAPCFATWTSDLAPALAALGAKAQIVGPEGERSVPVEDLYLKKPPWKEVKSNEILKEIEIPNLFSHGRFIKHALWKSKHFSIVSIATAINVENSICKGVRMFLGAVAPTLFRATEVEEMLTGEPLKEELIERGADLVSEKANPLPNNSFKVRIVKGLIKKALRQIQLTFPTIG